MKNCTTTSTQAFELNSESMLEAIEAVRNMVPSPYIVESFVRDYEELKDLPINSGARNLFGFRVHIDPRMNENEIRVVMSDGTQKVCKIRE